MLSFRTAMACLWVGAALCAGAAPGIRAETFTLNNACLKDREPCLKALGREAPPVPEVETQAVTGGREAPLRRSKRHVEMSREELATQAVAETRDAPILLSNRHLGLSREELAALGVVAGQAPVEKAVESVEVPEPQASEGGLP